MPVLDLYFQNFLQKLKFMQYLGLNYSKKNTCREEMKYTTQISCPCRLRNTPYLKWLLSKSLSGGLSKFSYIWHFLNFEQRLTTLLKIPKKIKCMQTLTGRHSSFKKTIILSRGCFRNGMNRRFAWYISFPLYTYFSLSN